MMARCQQPRACRLHRAGRTVDRLGTGL